MLLEGRNRTEFLRTIERKSVNETGLVGSIDSQFIFVSCSLRGLTLYVSVILRKYWGGGGTSSVPEQ